jgi:hypothetical protein
MVGQVTKQTDTGKAVVRETRGEWRERPVIAEIRPGFLVVRLKGTQQSWTIDWASVAQWAKMRQAKQERGDIPPRKITGSKPVDFGGQGPMSGVDNFYAVLVPWLLSLL